MYENFMRRGELIDLKSYPEWAGELVESTQASKRKIVEHELFAMMKEARLSEDATANLLIGTWPVIEQFPKYMSLNLGKTLYGRSIGEDMARKFFMRNICIEQHHADYWTDWAAACGIGKQDLFNCYVPVESQALQHWCAYACQQEPLPVSIAATNFAIKGAMGQWSTLVCSSEAYQNSFAERSREKAMAWVKVNAHYDDTHSWEALDIICSLVGNKASHSMYSSLQHGIDNSYKYMAISLDRFLLDAVS